MSILPDWLFQERGKTLDELDFIGLFCKTSEQNVDNKKNELHFMKYGTFQKG